MHSAPNTVNGLPIEPVRHQIKAITREQLEELFIELLTCSVQINDSLKSISKEQAKDGEIK